MVKRVIVFLLVALPLCTWANNISSHYLTFTKDGYDMKLFYFRNYPIDSVNNAIKRVVFVIHGANRNADFYYDDVINGAKTLNNALDSAIVIAPLFITEDDIEDHNLDNTHLFWSSGGWKIGHLSKNTANNPRFVSISSYAIIDEIIERLVSNMPNLEMVVMTGHSAGGQFANRYAAGSFMPETLRDNHDIHFRGIPTNPSSYVYLSGDRRIDGTVDQFESPSGCPGYNEYKYGLADLNTYMSIKGIGGIQMDYIEREMIYLLGSLDNNPNSNQLDISCEANLQGAHRLERGIIYYNHLNHFYEGFGELEQILLVVDGVGHSPSGIFSSDEFLTYAFGSTTTISGISEKIDNSNQDLLLNTYPNPSNGRFTVEMSDVRCQMSDVRCQMSDVRCQTVSSVASAKGDFEPQLDIINIQGQKVHTQGVTHNKTQLDVSSLPNGVYYLRLNSGNKSATKKIVVLR